MNYEDYLRSPDVQKAYDIMFEQQRKYYRVKSKELGIESGQIEVFSIHMASVKTDMHFSEQFAYKKTK